MSICIYILYIHVYEYARHGQFYLIALDIKMTHNARTKRIKNVELFCKKEFLSNLFDVNKFKLFYLNLFSWPIWCEYNLPRFGS